jgi:hypothetical protein
VCPEIEGHAADRCDADAPVVFGVPSRPCTSCATRTRNAGYSLGLPVDAVVVMCGPDLLENRVRARWGAERVPGLPEDEQADEQRSQQEIAEDDSRRSHFVPSNRLAAQC